MLTRRKFLKGSLATLIMVPLAGCSTDESSPMGAGWGNGTPSGCQGASSTGSNSAGHVHTLCVPDSDLTSPPAGRRTYTTSSDAGHTHTVTLIQAQLQTVAGGGTATVTSSVTGHTHDFLVEKVA